MKILAIETSCDDTGIAILQANKNGDFKILSNIVSSQIEVHKKYGGVHPALAKREHQKNLVPTFIEALKKANLLKVNLSVFFAAAKNTEIYRILQREPELLKQLLPFLKKYEKPDIDLISVTNGPGLEPCLWVGVNFAKALSSFWNIPIVPVNHIESHILVNLLENKNIKFPAVALVVSGGHTQIILVKKIPACRQAGANYKILGETRDDAAGECFDKCAKILGLGYPGGPIIAELAQQLKSRSPNPKAQTFGKLPRPMIGTKDYDFSFSGLKTAVLYADRKIVKKDSAYKKAMSAEVQQAIIDVLIKKTTKAIKDFNARSLILGGGVSANQELRSQFKLKIKNLKIDFLVPEPALSTDNAVMTAITGYFHKNKTQALNKISADGNLRIK